MCFHLEYIENAMYTKYRRWLTGWMQILFRLCLAFLSTGNKSCWSGENIMTSQVFVVIDINVLQQLRNHYTVEITVEAIIVDSNSWYDNYNISITSNKLNYRLNNLILISINVSGFLIIKCSLILYIYIYIYIYLLSKK